ncbi:MAG: XRE family transcriptional regulator, partial [Eubacteriales bacterium]|nr:XRE family transcriptional regulator [Eubacteriales bacterium]
MSKCGLNINRPMTIIKVSKGLSLNDCYWVVEEGFDGTHDKFNLYDNRFSQVLALIAFTGYGSSVRT